MVVLMNNSKIWSVEKKTTDVSVIALPLNKGGLYDIMVGKEQGEHLISNYIP